MEKWGFTEYTFPGIFSPGPFCLEIFAPGILFHGKFWHSDQAPQYSEQQKQVRFQHTHNQGLRKLFLTVSWDQTVGFKPKSNLRPMLQVVGYLLTQVAED